MPGCGLGRRPGHDAGHGAAGAPLLAGRCPPRRFGSGPARGFTLIELLMVLALVALSTAVVTLSLRNTDADRLDEEGARLATLLETARAEARVSGVPVRWQPLGPEQGALPGQLPPQFRFLGLSKARTLPSRWLDPEVSAEVVGDATLLLGPEAILPPQRVRLRLRERTLELATDGLGPFAPAAVVAGS